MNKLTKIVALSVIVGLTFAAVAFSYWQTKENEAAEKLRSEQLALQQQKQLEAVNVDIENKASANLQKIADTPFSPEMKGTGLPPVGTPSASSKTKFVERQVTLKGSHTLYPTKRKVTKSGYTYILNAEDGKEYVLNPINFYTANRTSEIEAALGEIVEVSGKVYQEFVDPNYPGETQYVVLIEEIKVAE